METLLSKLAFTIAVLLNIIILSLLIPVIFSVFISLATPVTFTECVQTAPFWIFTIIGVIVSSIYVNEVVVEIINNKQ